MVVVMDARTTGVEAGGGVGCHHCQVSARLSKGLRSRGVEGIEESGIDGAHTGRSVRLWLELGPHSACTARILHPLLRAGAKHDFKDAERLVRRDDRKGAD